MKKLFVIGAVSLVVLLAASAAGIAYAQKQLPPVPEFVRGMMSGQAVMNGRGMMAAQWNYAQQGAQGPIHDYMVAAAADPFGLTPEELQTRLSAGETMWQIAEGQGLSTEEFREVMAAARDQAVEQAVADGIFTQEQADRMKGGMGRMWGNGFAHGYMAGQGMMGGFGPGEPGIMHEYMLPFMAAALDMTAEELQARLDEGVSMWQAASEQGLDEQAIRDLMLTARTKAVESAVEAGLLPEESGALMLERMDTMMNGVGGGLGPCHSGQGARGGGMRGFGGGRNR